MGGKRSLIGALGDHLRNSTFSEYRFTKTNRKNPQGQPILHFEQYAPTEKTPEIETDIAYYEPNSFYDDVRKFLEKNSDQNIKRVVLQEWRK